MSVFKVEDGLLILDKDEIRSIPEFRRLLERDRGSEGDADGRKKYKTLKEFKFIYFAFNLGSIYASLPDVDRIKRSLSDAELDAKFNYKKDEDLCKAIDKYIELNLVASPATKILNSLERGLHTSDKVVNEVVNLIERTLERARIDPEAIMDVNGLVSNIGTLISISTSIPKALVAIEEIREKVKKEHGEDLEIKSGRSLGGRENPDYIKHKFKE